MRGYIIGVIIWCSVCTQGLFGQTFTITGKILNSKSKEGVGFAAVSFADNRLWTVADEAGRFVLRDVPGGKTVLLVHCLGYVTKSFDIEVKNDIGSFMKCQPLILGDSVNNVSRSRAFRNSCERTQPPCRKTVH